MSTPRAPLLHPPLIVPPEWIDLNGHMNATHYFGVVYEAHVRFTDELGLGEAYVAASRHGKAVLESHLVYEREVSLGDRLQVASWLLAVDEKRLHVCHEVHNLTLGARAATSEQVDVHLDLGARRAAPWPLELYRALQDRVRVNLLLPRPERVGSRLRPPENAWLADTVY